STLAAPCSPRPALNSPCSRRAVVGREAHPAVEEDPAAPRGRRPVAPYAATAGQRTGAPDAAQAAVGEAPPRDAGAAGDGGRAVAGASEVRGAVVRPACRRRPRAADAVARGIHHGPGERGSAVPSLPHGDQRRAAPVGVRARPAPPLVGRAPRLE